MIGAFISVILGLLVANVVITRPMSQEEMKQIGFYRFERPRQLSNFTMLDHHGNNVDLSEFKGKWTLLFFGFTTCPDICPTTLGVLSKALEGLDHPPQVVMVTVDPDRDTIQRLQAYIPAFNSDFRGFVGSFDQTVHLAEQVNVAFGKIPGREPGTYLVDHTASIILIDPEARYAGFIKAPHRLRNIQRLLQAL